MSALDRSIPAFHLYGERLPFPDVMHMERIIDRAAGLDWRIRPHRHTHLLQIFLLLSGQIRFHLDGNSHVLAPPVVLCLPPGVVHGFGFSAGTEGWVLSLPVQHYPELLGTGAELTHILNDPAILAPPPGLSGAFAGLHAAWAGTARLRRTDLRCRLGQLLCQLFEDRAGRPAPPPNTGPDPRMARFRALIAEHHAAHWSIDRYARELGLSVRHLGRLCRADTGLSAQGLIEAHRMREASRLLVYTQMSAQSVAHQLGYDDPGYFNRRFRAWSGRAPGAYRRALEQQPPG